VRKPLVEDAYYHLYLRGIDKKDIFLDEKDYQRFLNLLIYCNRKNSVSFSTLLRKTKSEIDKALNIIKEELGEIIIATLMPNHFHICIKCLEDKSVGKFMQKVLGSYAMYFNRRYKKEGRKFERSYQYRQISDDNDLQNTIDYIYNNPAKLLDKKYKHIKLLNGQYQLSIKQKFLVKNYPYTYKGLTFVEYKKQFELEF
jgi:putative transposase